MAVTSTCDEVSLFLAGLDPGQVQQIQDQLPHAVQANKTSIKHVVVGVRIVASGAFSDDPQIAFDRTQRRFQFVGQHRNELETNLAFLFGQSPGFPLQQHCLAALRTVLRSSSGVKGLARKS